MSVETTLGPDLIFQCAPTPMTKTTEDPVQPQREGRQVASNQDSSGDTESQSLWTRAVVKLSLTERAALADFGMEDTTDVVSTLESIRTNTERIMNANRERAWKTQLRGQEIVLANIGMKILHWIDKFKQVGDIVVQYDPGHAALPWAAFWFLLQVGPPLPLWLVAG